MSLWVFTTVFCALIVNTVAGSILDRVIGETTTGSNHASEKQRLLFIYNPETNIHVAMNGTANTVPVLDSRHNISTLYNGRTGAALAFNYETGISYYIPPGSGVTWLSSKTSYEDYFGDLPSQLKLYEYGETHGVRFESTTVTEEISDAMVEILAPLSEEYDERCQALATYMQVSRITSDSLTTSLVGLHRVISRVGVPFRGDFKWLIGIYQGLGEFFGAIPGGMSALVEKNVTLDMHKILTHESGIYVLIYFLEELSESFDIAQILGKTLNDPYKFFSLIDKLGGQMSYGFDGHIHVLNEILKFHSNRSSIATLKLHLRDYAGSSLTNGAEILDQFNRNIRDLSTTITKLQLNESLGGLSNTLRDIRDGRWKHNNLNLSNIVEVLSKVNRFGGDILITELLRLLEVSTSIQPNGQTISSGLHRLGQDVLKI